MLYSNLLTWAALATFISLNACRYTWLCVNLGQYLGNCDVLYASSFWTWLQEILLPSPSMNPLFFILFLVLDGEKGKLHYIFDKLLYAYSHYKEYQFDEQVYYIIADVKL